MTGDERSHQGPPQGSEVGGQVDIHVRQHGGIRIRPDGVQRTAAPLLLQSDHPDSIEFFGELRGDARGGVVDTGVVGDGDTHRVGQGLGQVAVQPMHRARQRCLLVVDGHHDVENRDAAAGGIGQRARPRRRGHATFEGRGINQHLGHDHEHGGARA